MPHILARPALALCLLLAAAPAAARQDGGRSLYWDSVSVQARLDAAGRLHVTERQDMVFQGNWNGGERRFHTPQGQDLQVTAMTAIDPATGAEVAMTPGNLDRVNGYGWAEGALRWRSRLASDPPFQDAHRAYVIQYTVSNAVIPTDSGYLLDYDFLFADRDGGVGRVTLTLTLDAAWAPPPGYTGTWATRDLPPGQGFAVRVPLRYTAPGRPATVPAGVSTGTRAMLLLLLLGGGALLAVGFRRRELDGIRQQPLLPPHRIDEAWLREHVLHLPAELVGAAWDRSTGGPEVAGLLARLVAEEKLASRVEVREDNDSVLHLELLEPIDNCEPHARPLLRALFFDGRTVTDTASIKDHYEDRGFDPAAKIRDALDKQAARLPGAGKVPRPWVLPALLMGCGLNLLVLALVRRPEDLPVALVTVVLALGPGLIAAVVAAVYAGRITGLGGLRAGFLIPLGLALLPPALVVAGVTETSDPDGGLGSPYLRLGVLTLLALTLVALGLVAQAFTLARPTETPERLAFRRRLAAARAYFEAELRRAEPALRDAWYPYLLAFGLGPDVDRWFGAFGPPSRPGHGHTVRTSSGVAAAAAAASTGAGWTGGGALFGGGGGFAGGGVGRTWSSAATGIASGVAAPSSSSSGGFSGGASAGGGGGGGW